MIGSSKFVPSVVFLVCFLVIESQCSVTYDRKSFIINGQRRLLIAGEMHYPRNTPDMWEGLVQKAKDGGVDVISTYVFWNAHEPSPGNYYFGGRFDLVRFIKTVQKAGLYVFLRIGPYVCAEWNFGGFPVWLKYVPDIEFRVNNEPYKNAMQSFTQKIVQMLKDESLFEPQGGPIILAQIENEYGFFFHLFDRIDVPYVKWAGQMAVSMDTGVPWVMSADYNTPDPVINGHNEFYCDVFVPNRPNKPIVWVEAWLGWFSKFGEPIYERPAEDLAFAVAQFFLHGGSFVNLYVYHGGTNFGRTSGGPFMTTRYDYDSPIDEYGYEREPKYGHLKELSRAIKLCEEALVSADPIVTSLGRDQLAHVYYTKSGKCAAFLSNLDTNSSAQVIFNNMHYILLPWSISILPDCRNVVFNTATVGVQKSHIQMVSAYVGPLEWERYNEDIDLLANDSQFAMDGLFDQLNITRDTTDYLWYITSVDVNPTEGFFRGGKLPTLFIEEAGPELLVFINGKLSGSSYGGYVYPRTNYSGTVNLCAGTNQIALLSVSVGLPNVGAFFELWPVGVKGSVVLNGFDQGRRTLTRQKWYHKIGLTGESMNLRSIEGSSSVEWIRGSLAVQTQQPLTWYRTFINTPDGDEPLALDMGSMQKGMVWINGESIGRYYTLSAPNGICKERSYVGPYVAKEHQTGCGQPTQRWYRVPRSWLKPKKNLLVIFEEFGGDVTKISLVKVKRSMPSVSDG